MKSMLLRRRPSAPLIISVLALFFALGGVGYAALGPGSVGTAQLKNGSVTNRKIHNGAVTARKIAFHTIGARRVNPAQIQLRVNGRCSGPSGAIGSIDRHGNVGCNATLPREFRANAGGIAVGTTATTVVSRTLGTGNYFLLAFPYATITSSQAGQRVQVTCTLGLGISRQTRSVVIEVGPSTRQQVVAIPLSDTGTVKGSSDTASVTCQQLSGPATPAPTVSIQSALDAIETFNNI